MQNVCVQPLVLEFCMENEVNEDQEGGRTRFKLLCFIFWTSKNVKRNLGVALQPIHEVFVCKYLALISCG